MRTTVSIPGMHCKACETLIHDVSSEFPTITGIVVDLSSKKLTVEHKADFDLAAWSGALGDLGPEYRVQPS